MTVRRYKTQAILTGLKTCAKCNQIKPTDEFYSYGYTTNQGKRSIRFDSRCNECARTRRRARYGKVGHIERAYARKYKISNKIRLDGVFAIYCANNREKILASRRSSEAKRRGAVGSAKGRIILQVLNEAKINGGYWDAYDGCIIPAAQVDHIRPISKGGPHEYDNLCVTSKSNNSRKKDRSLLIWLLERTGE